MVDRSRSGLGQWILVWVAALGLLIFGTACRGAGVNPPRVVDGGTPQPTVTFGIALPTVTSGAESGTIPTRTPEPLVPTMTPQGEALTATVMPPTGGMSAADRARFGVSGLHPDIAAARALGLPFEHILDWLYENPATPIPDVTYWRMMRTRESGFRRPLERYLAVARANPGSIWIVGNEPDVRWQDNVTPETYARLYGEAYAALKQADPTARVAPAGVAQGTPLRLAYLDRVLAAYAAQYGAPLPADIWTVHAFTLREERESWGVDIPAGMSEDAGALYEIDDHADLAIFTQNIVNFRRWMADNGYRDTPLAVTEMGILLPNDYGFPPELVQQYMRDLYDTLLALRDPQIGLPADDDRLVQTWFWYIVFDAPDRYPVGNLYDPLTDRLTPLGETHRDYLGQP